MGQRGIKHYHAYSGMPGYSPNQTMVGGSLEECRAWAQMEAEHWRDGLPDGVRLAGSRKLGYWHEVKPGSDESETAFPETIEVPGRTSACYCEEVWRCANGTWVDEPGSCWCCGEKPPAAN